jgi:hypothetical protein
VSESIRAFLAAAGASGAASICASEGSAAAKAPARVNGNVAGGLVELSLASNTALMRGDIDRYRALINYTEDFTLLSPFGGEPTHGRNLTVEA